MKKNFMLLLLVAGLSGMFACNGSKEEDKSVETLSDTTTTTSLAAQRDCAGSDNFFISEDYAKEMIHVFDSIYRSERIPGLLNSVWVDASVIIALSKYIDSTQQHTGVRIYNGAYDSVGGYSGQRFPFESTILLSVTNAPNSKADSVLSKHKDDWNVKLSPRGQPTFINHSLTMDKADKFIRMFGRKYRGEKDNGDYRTAINNSLSRAVWFDSCVIGKIADYLSDSKNGLDGVRIYSGAYSKKTQTRIATERGQNHENQSTFLIVVTRNGGKDDWKFLDNKKANLKPFDGAYNHGQLCPQLCP